MVDRRGYAGETIKGKGPTDASDDRIDYLAIFYKRALDGGKVLDVAFYDSKVRTYLILRYALVYEERGEFLGTTCDCLTYWLV